MVKKKVYARGIFPMNTRDEFLGEFSGTLVFLPVEKDRVSILEIQLE